MIIDRTKHPQYSYEGIEIPSSCIKEKRDDQILTLLILDVSVIYLYVVVSDRKGSIMLQKLYVFFRKETVLSIAVILAILSMFWVRPDKAYFTYIDFRTLGLLFCLMAIVAGLKAVGVFDILAQKLLMGTSGTESSPNLCVNSSFSYVVLSTLLLSSRDLTEWSLVYHNTLSYQRFYDLHSIHYDHLEGLHQLI